MVNVMWYCCIVGELTGKKQGDQTRHHILMLKLLPTVENVFNIVVKDERQKMIKPIIHSDHVVFYAHGHTVLLRPMLKPMLLLNNLVVLNLLMLTTTIVPSDLSAHIVVSWVIQSINVTKSMVIHQAITLFWKCHSSSFIWKLQASICCI